MSTATLTVKVDSKGAVRDVQQLDTQLGRLETRATTTNEKMKKFGAGAKQAFALGAVAATASAAAIVKVLDSLDRIGKQADKVGVSTKALQELRAAGELSGASVTVTDLALQRFGRRSAEAANGTGTLKKVFEELGISARDAGGNIKSNESLLYEFAEALKNVESPSERLRLNMAAFDTEGVAFGESLKNGAAGLDKLRASMTNVIPEQTIRDAEAANDAMTNLSNSSTVLFQSIVAKGAPALQGLAEWLQALPSYFERVSFAVSDFFTAIREGLEAVGEFADAVQKMATDSVKYVKDMVAGIKKYLGSQFDSIMEGVGDKVEAVTGFFAEMYDKVIGNSYVPDMVDGIEDHMGRLDEVMVDQAADATGETEKEFESFADNSVKIFDNMVENIQRAFGDLIYDNFKSILDDGKLTFKDFTDTILDMFLRMIADMASAWLSSKIAGLFSGGFSFGGLASGISGALSGVSSAIGGALSGGASAIGGALSSAGGGIASLFGGGGGGVVATGLGDSLVPAVASELNAATVASNAFNASLSSGINVFAKWAPPVALAGIALQGIFKRGKIAEENAKFTDEFNRLRLSTEEFAGELIEVNDSMNIVGSSAEALYVRMHDQVQGSYGTFSEWTEMVRAAGGEIRQIYYDTGDQILMITGNIAESQEIIAKGFEIDKVRFTEFKQSVTGGLNVLTAAFSGNTAEWQAYLENAMASGALSADASFKFIEDESGQTFIQMMGQASEWSDMLMQAGKVGVGSVATEFSYLGYTGQEVMGNLTAQAGELQSALSAIRMPSLDYASARFAGVEGFAHGGSFTVGGSGGTDSTPVSFMATPGERVTVETPQQQNSSERPIVINIESDGKGLDQFIRVVADDHRVQVNRSQVRATERIY